MTVSFRDGSAADAEAIDRAFRTTFCETFAHLYRTEDLQAFLARFTVDAWRSELASRDFAFRLAEEDSTVAGFAKLGPLDLPLDSSGPGMLLKQLYDTTAHQGAGIAPVLMDWVMAEARSRGNRELYLTVFTENHRARRFYERYGFEAVGRYDFMGGTQADEDVIMRKLL
jgi:GNAT superfamily N-acetyltransferase